MVDVIKSNQFYSEAQVVPQVREGPNYTEAGQLLIFSTRLIYVTLVGTEAATFGLADQHATTAPHGARLFVAS